MSPWRYFLVVQPFARVVPAAFAVVTLYGWYVIWLSPDQAATPLALVLLVQVFAAATGFRKPARAGYYDAVLIAGQPRACATCAHLAWSAAPGAGAWLMIGLGEVAMGAGRDAAALQPAGWLAFTIVSTVTWALSVPTGRLAGGVVWVVTLAGVLGSDWGRTLVRTGLDTGTAGASPGVIEQAGTLLLMPWLLLEPSLNPEHHIVIVLCGVPIALAAAAAVYVTVSDWPLGPAE